MNRTVNRTVRILTTVALALGISLSSGASWAHAQEMDHGRGRPSSRTLQSNQIKTVEQIQIAAASNIRG